MADTPWTGIVSKKLYLQSGQFTSTLKTSEDISGIDGIPSGISWDGTNTPWSGQGIDKLHLQSGQFTSTLKDSEDVSTIDNLLRGLSWDGTNTPWIGDRDNKLYLQSGQFTSTLKTSESIVLPDNVPSGISWDGTNTPWSGEQANKLYLQSGQFTSTLKTSEDVSAIEATVQDVSWDGTNTPWTGYTDGKLYLQSGQFTSTLKTSEDINSIDGGPTGICTNDINGRLGIIPIIYEKSVTSNISFIQTVGTGGSIYIRSLSHAMSLSQVGTRTFEESVSSPMSLNQAISRTMEWDRSLSDTLSLSDQADKTEQATATTVISLIQAVTANKVGPTPITTLKGGNRTLNRFIRRTLYSLKRQYGNRVDVYQLHDVETDYQTGDKTVEKAVNIVRKCIVLPVKIAREVVQTISNISANKMFVMGGTFDAGTRMFIIDTRDMPDNYEFTNDDWIVYKGRRYDIKSYEEFEQHTAWSIIGREVKGVRPEQVFFAHITEQLSLEQTANGTTI